ncbi:MAG TPA: hypothetical protein VNA04_11315 [Thermoanaerobaculia bacterium]|nr:hypothetical protein [Thermoanaerobaculia bacterium]
MHRTLAAVLSLSFVFAGCKAKEALDAASISKELQKKGTTDLMREAAEDSYDPPADGKLTDAQIQMYLKVREEEKKIARVAKDELKQHADKAGKAGEKSLSGMIAGFKSLGSAADVLTADIRAAKHLGYNSQEYLWVKEKVLEVSGAAMADQMNQVMSAQMDAAIAQTRKAHDAATDPSMKKMYAEMLAGYDQTRKEMAQEDADPALAHNRRLVAKYENELTAYASELAKWTDDTDAQKSVDDWQKQLDKAASDAKKQQ